MIAADGGFDPVPASRHRAHMSEGRRHTMDRCWRKSRIAARILLRHEAGKTTARDVRLAQILAADKGVTSRLIDQAIHGIRGRAYRLAIERGQAA